VSSSQEIPQGSQASIHPPANEDTCLFALKLPLIDLAMVHILHSTQTAHALASPTHQAPQRLYAAERQDQKRDIASA
jgi:hypothetical protein